MLNDFASTAKDLLKKPARLFTHGIVYGSAIFQFATATPAYAALNETSLPPETQAAVLQGMKDTVKDVPVRFVQREKLNLILSSFSNAWGKEGDGLQVDGSTIQNENDLAAYLNKHSAGFPGDNDDQTPPLTPTNIDHEALVIHTYYNDHKSSGPQAITTSQDTNMVRMISVDGVQNLLASTPYEKSFLDQSLGVPGLQEACLGPDGPALIRAYLLWHELEHARDMRPQATTLDGEILADVNALEKFSKIVNRPDFVTTLKHWRALTTALGDVDHADHFELGLLDKEPGYPYMSPEDTTKAARSLETLRKPFPEKGIASLWTSEEETIRERLEFRYNELASFIKASSGDPAAAADLTPRQRERLQDPKVQTLLYTTQVAWEFFDDKLATYGLGMPAPVPDSKIKLPPAPQKPTNEHAPASPRAGLSNQVP